MLQNSNRDTLLYVKALVRLRLKVPYYSKSKRFSYKNFSKIPRNERKCISCSSHTTDCYRVVVSHLLLVSLA